MEILLLKNNFLSSPGTYDNSNERIMNWLIKPMNQLAFHESSPLVHLFYVSDFNRLI